MLFAYVQFQLLIKLFIAGCVEEDVARNWTGVWSSLCDGVGGVM